MSVWRPEARIRFKALGLPRRGDRLLAAEVSNDDGSLKGVRPLGGGVAFGETAQAAVIREFREELGLDVETVGPPVFLESIYTHHGHVGHEIVALFEIRLPRDACPTWSPSRFAKTTASRAAPRGSPSMRSIVRAACPCIRRD